MSAAKKRKLPRLLITPGEPAGIGPDVLIDLAQSAHRAQLVAVCDPRLLQERAKRLRRPLEIATISLDDAPVRHRAGTIAVLPVLLGAPVKTGVLDRRNAPYVLETLRVAAGACLRGQADALVTGPVQKSIINDAGIAFTGHTEFFSELTRAKLPVMMLAARGLRVALATTHLSLADVPAAITRKSLTEVVTILHRDLVARFGIRKPRILVCGLNPHAGEGGHLGREEIEVIAPVLAALRRKGMLLEGPLPADTLFQPKYLNRCDAVLAMYHDQGLPVLKFAGFGESVNITLGLPIIRTSVDHGTALDLAGSGKADAGSLRAAVAAALELSSHA